MAIGIICNGCFSLMAEIAILAAPFLNGCNSCVFRQMPSMNINTIFCCTISSRDFLKAYSLRCRFSLPSDKRYTGIMCSRPSKKRCQGFRKASPLAKKCTGSLNWAAIRTASRKELGWLATSKRGPFSVLNSGFISSISTQKIRSASLIGSFRSV